MMVTTDKLEFKSQGIIKPESDVPFTEVPDVVTERLASEIGDIEVQEMKITVAKIDEEMMYKWEVAGRRSPMSL